MLVYMLESVTEKKGRRGKLTRRKGSTQNVDSSYGYYLVETGAALPCDERGEPIQPEPEESYPSDSAPEPEPEPEPETQDEADTDDDEPEREDFEE